MSAISSTYRQPPVTKDASGADRLVGFELEFIGLTLEKTASLVRDTFTGTTVRGTKAEQEIEVDGLGKFGIELDWDFLKKQAKADSNATHVDLLRDAAIYIVPMEVVCPPLPVSSLSLLDPLISRLHAAGARGTDDSLVAAFGVHINVSLPALDAATVDRYLKAFCLLQPWLIRKHDVNFSRRVTPYINPYPEAYLRMVIETTDPSLDMIITEYLLHNATRNRALDMLPLFKHLDPQRIDEALDDDRIKARPAFHYRLPNCLIGSAGWSLHQPWSLWCVLEELANREADLALLRSDFLEAWRPLLGIDQTYWIEKIESWANRAGLV